jgi:hypothetical protein
MPIVLYVALGKVLADPIVALDVIRSEIPAPVCIDFIEIPMRRRFTMHIILADIVRVGGGARE